MPFSYKIFVKQLTGIGKKSGKGVLMNKKVLLLALIMVMAVSSLFAVNNVVFVTGSPYAKQYVNSSVDTHYSSNYGFGFKAGYRHFDSVVLWGADIAYQNFKYTNKDTDATAYLGNLQILAKVGGKAVLSETVDLNGDIGCGLDIDFSRVAVNCNFVIAGSGSLSVFVAPKVAVVGGLDVSVVWAKSQGSVYKTAQWNLVPHIGAEIDF